MSAAPDSIRADLEAAMKTHAEPEATEVETPEVVAEPEAPVIEKTAEERARDERGRFVAKEGTDPQGGQPGDAATGVAAKSGADTSVQQPPVPAADAADGKPSGASAALAPPNGWSAEAKAKWHELPAEVMAAVQKREQDVTKFTSTRDEHASFGKEVYQTVQPYLAQIQAEGGTATSAIKSLLNTAYVLRTGSPEQKRQVLLDAAQTYGVDLGVAPKTGAPNVAPELAPLYDEINQLKGVLTERDRALRQQLQNEVQTEIAAFAADPKHQHYESVKGHMAALIDKGLAKDLQDAYDQAVWARPDTRATLEAQRRAEEEQKRRTEAKAKADAARKKSVSITGGPGNTANASAPGSRSIRDELEAAMAASGGSV